MMKVGFIGAGNMAKAMIGGMLQKQLLQKEEIIASSATQGTADKVAGQFGIKTTLVYFVMLALAHLKQHLLLQWRYL